MDCTITLAIESDAPEIAAIYAPYVLNTPVSFEYDPPSAEEIASRIRKVRADELPWLVAKDSGGKLLGYAYATKHKERAAYQWCVESSVYVDPTIHRSGIGRALYTRLFEILKELGYQNVFAGATVPNDETVKFHESFGFTVAARYQNIGFKHGKWHNTIWWQKTLGPPPSEPSSPKPLSSVNI